MITKLYALSWSVNSEPGESMMHLLRRYGRSTVYLMATDWMILVGTFGLALHWRRYEPDLNIISRSLHISGELLTVLLYAFMMIGIFGALNLYKRKTLLSPTGHFLRIVQGVAFCVLGYLLLRTSIKFFVFVPSRLVLINWTFMQFSALVIHRQIIFPAMFRIATRAQMQRRVVIIGVSDASITFTQQLLAQQRFATLKPIGFISNRRNKEELVVDGLSCLGQINDLPELVSLHKIEGAILTETDLSYQDLMDLIERCVRLFGWVDVHASKAAVWHKNLDADTYFDLPFVRMREIPSGPLIHAYKEATDLIGALIGIVLLSPLLVATAIAIKLTSPGPVFYTRERIGKNGKPFPFYKFRSMTIGADQDQGRAANIQQYIQNEASGQQHKIVNTAYITPVGKFIRKWAIDELPQLFNVLKGNMSLIGPRPVPIAEHEVCDEWHKRRFDIKPGCTGLWKVYAAKTGVSFNETVLYDLYYARNMNPLLDLYIVLMTIWVILSGRADG